VTNALRGQECEHSTCREGATCYKDTLMVDLWYPRVEGELTKISIGLVDVRAADDIQVSYDFERDGWVIKQASVFEWEADDAVCDQDWREVAFVKAWGREKTSE